MVLNLNKPVKLKHFLLSKPYRLIFDLYPEGASPAEVLKSPPPAASNDIDDLEQELIAKLNKMPEKINDDIDLPSNNLREIVVVIDPGHGGRDSGAVGPHGQRKKM